MKITLEQLGQLLAGYRTEYPFLVNFLREELSKDAPSKEVVEKTENAIFLYELMFQTVMSMGIRYRLDVVCHYFSEAPKTYEQAALELGVHVSTHTRRLAESKRRVLSVMNGKLSGMIENEKPHKT